MPTPKTNWVEGEYFTPAAANIVGQAIVDLQNEFTTVESVLRFMGTWNATTNTPALANGTGTAGHTYLVTTAGTALGKTFNVGDYAVYSGSIWDRATSVASQVTSSGAVTGSTLVSTVADGTAPLTVTSTTNVLNLNASTVNSYGPSLAAGANTLAARDSAANLYADNFISSVQSNVTAAGITTLLVASTQVQVFTGTTTQTVLLPTNSIVAGQTYTIINQSTGSVTVQSSTGATISTVASGYSADFTALTALPTTAANWRGITWPLSSAPLITTGNSLSALSTSTSNSIGVGNIELGHASDTTLSRSAAGTLAVEGVDVVTTTGTQAISGKTSITSTGAVTGSTLVSNVAQGTPPLTVTSTTTVSNLSVGYVNGAAPSTSATSSSIAQRDTNGGLTAKNFISSFVTQATTAGTTTLTVASAGMQEFTGTTTQTVALPTTSVFAGMTFTIINNSSGAVTVQSSALATIGAVLTTGTSAQFIALVAAPTTAANWHRR